MLPEAALRVCRIVRAAFGAVEHQIVDLTVLCMQQNGTAISAGIIDRVIAGFENRRSADDGGNDLQADFAVRGHGSLPYCRRERYRTLSHRRLAHGRCR